MEVIVLVIFILSACIKILLFPAYKSTDFEVHRNWLAITHSLPLSEWYYEDTSQWTLDYPPFFACFEWFLSQFAVLIDPAIVQVTNLNYSANSVVYFQRGTVILTEALLCYAVMEYCRYREGWCVGGKHDLFKFVLSFQLLTNFGLLIVDHIHFQYNGFLFGILLLSITRIAQERLLEGSVWFACLLNFKHIFLYIAPAYGVYLFKHYCFERRKKKTGQLKVSMPTSLSQLRLDRFLLLAVTVITIFIASFGPFITMGQLGQVISRLFPFKRGLCHAYWAPNVWAIYNICDKFLAITGSITGTINVSTATTGSSMTTGLVGEMNHQVLPSIPPIVTLTLTVLSLIPSLWRLWSKPSTGSDFIRMIVICAYSSFLFGWHVHEKAIMMVTIPMSLLALEDSHFTRVYLLVTVAGHISLFPLLFTSAETLIKVVMFILFTAASFLSLSLLMNNKTSTDDNKSEEKQTLSLSSFKLPSLTLFDTLLIIGVIIVQAYCIILGSERFPFLPLLLTSGSCSVVIVWSWILTLRHDDSV